MKNRFHVGMPLALVTLALTLVSPAQGAGLRVSNYFSDNMVLQRGKPVTVWGESAPSVAITVTFAGQNQTANADKAGKWAVTLDPLAASAAPATLTVKSSVGNHQSTINNVLVGDVWLFGRQTYVDISLGRNAEGQKAAKAFKPTDTFRAMVIRTEPATAPLDDLSDSASDGWVPVDAEQALTMSGAAFYLGRDLAAESDVPVGIVDLNMSHYFGIGWLSDKAIEDAKTLHPDDKEIDWIANYMREEAEARESGEAQKALDAYYEGRMKGKGEKPSLGLHPLQNPMFPSAGYNAVIAPLQHATFKGILLQLGNDYPFIPYRELEKAGTVAKKSAFDAAWHVCYPIIKNGYRMTPVTLPYVPGDWRRTFGDATLPIGLVLPPGSDLDVYAAHNREIRELHRRTAADAEGIGLILPGTDNIPMSGQPTDDRLLAERCKQWVLGTATGPLFDRAEARLGKATIYFKEGTADGLAARGNALDLFETAGPDRVFAPAKATLDGSTIKLKSDGPIAFVRYNWTGNPSQDLVNRAGLPALPFSTDPDWAFGWIPPPAAPDLPEEYTTTADKWQKSDIAIINGQIASMATGDSEPIPRRPGPIGIYSSPFGPNIIVISIDRGTPAEGRLMPGDIIYGVNGKSFSDEPGIPHDEQYRDLADAITYSESEAGEGKLVFSVRRGTKLVDVDVELEVLGSYSSTSPYYCEKSENIVKNAEAWASRRYRPETGMASQPLGMLKTDLLFLLASGTPEYQGLVRRAVYDMTARMDPKPVTPGMRSKPWATGYDSLVLGEYYHATGDRNILPYLKYQADLSAESQLKPIDETPAEWEAAQTEMQVGGWRQNSHTAPDRWQSGYGLMPHAGMPCVMGMVLAHEAGLDIDRVALKRGLDHFNKGRAEYGFVVYSYSGLRREGPPAINPDAESRGKLWSMNGKLGTAAALFRLVDYNDSVDICARHCVYGFNNTRGGHGGMFFNNLWTPIGAWAGGETAFKHFMKGQRWWRELFRRHDGSFNQVGRGGIGISYGIPYVAHKQKLRMLGAPKSAFGMNCPVYLEPAIEAHRQRDYARCEQLIQEKLDGIVPAEDLPVVNHLLESVRTLRASIEHDLALVESQIADGKHYYASLELPQLKGVVSEHDPRLQAIVAALESPEGAANVQAHRKLCEAEKNEMEAAAKQSVPAKAKENWVDLVADKSAGNGGDTWRFQLVEHIDQAPDDWESPKFTENSWFDAKVPISWCPYHTALFRTTFNIEDKDAFDGLRVQGGFFQQANVVIYLNGQVVAKVDNLDRGIGTTDARFTDYAMKLLKNGENTLAISSRHKRRWGPYRGTYKTAATVSFEVQALKSN